MSVKSVKFLLGLLLSVLLTIPAGAKDTKLVVMMPGSTGGVYPDGVIEGFNAKHPEIEVEVIGGGWGELLEKIPVLIAGGTAPDVWYGEAGRAAEWGYNGLIEDLKPYIDRDLNIDDYFLLEASSDPQGHVWGIPGGFQITTLWYLTHLFDEAAVAYPNDTWSVYDMVEAAKKLTRSDGDRVVQYGINMRPHAGTVGWLLWVHLMGGSVMDESLTQSRLASPDTIRALEFIRDLMWVEEAAPKFGTDSGFALDQQNLAMENHIYIRNQTLKRNGVTTYDVAKVPMGPNGDRYTTVVPNVWMINRDSPVKEAAWTFLKYYLSDEVQEKVVNKGSEVPVSKGVAPLFLSQPAPPQNLHNVLDSFTFAHTLDENAAWDSWWRAVPAELAPLFRNEEGAATAAARAQEVMQVILDDVYNR